MISWHKFKTFLTTTTTKTKFKISNILSSIMSNKKRKSKYMKSKNKSKKIWMSK